MTRSQTYSRVQILLHWLIAVLIIGAWFTSDGMGRALRQRLESGYTGITGNTPHVWLGGAVFALVLIRVLVRLRHGAPDHVAGTTPLMGLAATWGHRLLYLLMIATPALGAAVWYGGIREAGDLHEIVSNALMIVALGHAAIALVHHYFFKDDTLRRMLRIAG